jgi:sporulation protein YlmC with PRC-barrel domain
MPDDMPATTAAEIAATAPLTASSLLHRTVVDSSGRSLGRIVDLVVQADREGRQRLNAVVVTDGPWGRLLGYERDTVEGPWLIEALARWITRRHLRRLSWDEVRLAP